MLVGRPQTVCRGSTVAGKCHYSVIPGDISDRAKRRTGGSESYKTAQRGAILRAIGEYCPADRALPVSKYTPIPHHNL